jgi:hypothetical protein
MQQYIPTLSTKFEYPKVYMPKFPDLGSSFAAPSRLLASGICNSVPLTVTGSRRIFTPLPLKHIKYQNDAKVKFYSFSCARLSKISTKASSKPKGRAIEKCISGNKKPISRNISGISCRVCLPSYKK